MLAAERDPSYGAPRWFDGIDSLVRDSPVSVRRLKETP